MLRSAGGGGSAAGSVTTAGTLTAGQVAYGSGAQTITSSANFTYADATGARLFAATAAVGFWDYPTGQNAIGFSRNSTTGAFQVYGGATASPSDINSDFGVTAVAAILPAGRVYAFSSSNLTQAIDAGISRLGSGSLAVGNGTAGDFSGTLKLTTLNSVGAVQAFSATAIPAGGTAGAGVLVSSTANFGVFFGSGAPSLSAAKGSLYLRSDGTGIADRAYINTNGTTTWTNLVTAA